MKYDELNVTEALKDLPRLSPEDSLFLSRELLKMRRPIEEDAPEAVKDAAPAK